MSSASSLIRVYRPGSRLGFVILNPAFELLVDDTSHGAIWPKQVRSFAVNAGTHEVKVRSLGYRLGRKKCVTISPGETATLVLPHEWVMSITGQIKLHEASERDLVAIKALASTVQELNSAGEDD
jgi:hypothetical protein